TISATNEKCTALLAITAATPSLNSPQTLEKYRCLWGWLSSGLRLGRANAARPASAINTNAAQNGAWAPKVSVNGPAIANPKIIDRLAVKEKKLLATNKCSLDTSCGIDGASAGR